MDTATWGITACANLGMITLQCLNGKYILVIQGHQAITYVLFTASPFQLVADVVMTADPTNHCTGSYRLTITD